MKISQGLSLFWPQNLLYMYHKHDIRESGVKMGLAPLADIKFYM